MFSKAAGAEPCGGVSDRKLQSVVVRRRFGSQKTKGASVDEKSARRCVAKQMSKSKCQKHTTFGPLLDVQPSLLVASAIELHHCKIELNLWVL